MLSMEYFKQ